ncbi:MAG: bifunctional 4-hydroxy-2-oxoglutarate aldolase/2-dehydro-3-deoxy-phosphogluconate aldolase [Deltaproteobacteria bacterium]|nr:bifunctional 4-hydroxy-2-oxoglutarate aldolase/2-dehydro-3-deoxy-phosphogluconate aldolase [Deltaproteobacteria bacterium]
MIPILDQFEKIRVIPVVAIENAQDTTRLADALVEGGLPCAEITFRTPGALDAMRIMAKRGDILVGAGTVLKVDQVKAAADMGVEFMVSPGFNPKVVAYCVENNIIITPGICTPSDIEAALEFGLDALKFFPAEAFGGLKTLEALSGPYGMVRFIPTGGVGPGNLVNYLRFPKTLACGGTWIAKSTNISEGRFDLILNNAREAVALAKEAQAN